MSVDRDFKDLWGYVEEWKNRKDKEVQMQLKVWSQGVNTWGYVLPDEKRAEFQCLVCPHRTSRMNYEAAMAHMETQRHKGNLALAKLSL